MLKTEYGTAACLPLPQDCINGHRQTKEQHSGVIFGITGCTWLPGTLFVKWFCVLRMAMEETRIWLYPNITDSEVCNHSVSKVSLLEGVQKDQDFWCHRQVDSGERRLSILGYVENIYLGDFVSCSCYRMHNIIKDYSIKESYKHVCYQRPYWCTANFLVLEQFEGKERDIMFSMYKTARTIPYQHLTKRKIQP